MLQRNLFIILCSFYIIVFAFINLSYKIPFHFHNIQSNTAFDLFFRLNFKGIVINQAGSSDLIMITFKKVMITVETRTFSLC